MLLRWYWFRMRPSSLIPGSFFISLPAVKLKITGIALFGTLPNINYTFVLFILELGEVILLLDLFFVERVMFRVAHIARRLGRFGQFLDIYHSFALVFTLSMYFWIDSGDFSLGPSLCFLSTRFTIWNTHTPFFVLTLSYCPYWSRDSQEGVRYSGN
jgi:hypothetical protein